MKFEAHIICWNEAAVLPHILRYWRAAGIDKLVVHDNHSTDKTLTILSQDWGFEIEVQDYESGGHADDYIYKQIKDNCWKGSDAEWVFVGDTDEVPYCRKGVRNFLEQFPDDIAIVQPCLYQVLGWTMPAGTPPDWRSALLHQRNDMRVQRCGPNKVNLFRPSRVKEMNYGLGAHHCTPVGAEITTCEDIAWLHCKSLGVEYLLERNRQLYDRLPEQVKAEKRIATHYLPGTDVRNVARDLAEAWTNSERYDKYPVLL